MNTELIKHIGEGLSKTTPVCVQSRGFFHIFFSYMYDGYKPKDNDFSSEVIALWRLKQKQAPINNY